MDDSFFPSNGIWLVNDGSAQRISHIMDLPKKANFEIWVQFQMHKDDCVSHIYEELSKYGADKPGITYGEIAEIATDYFFKQFCISQNI